MNYDTEQLHGEIYSIFYPEPTVGNEGFEFHETPPLKKLNIEHSLDTSYWRPHEYGSLSESMRRTDIDDAQLGTIVASQPVPFELFLGTLRLFGDSILTYHKAAERHGPYRFYPAILMTAWASFEAFVRIYSELFVKTVASLPLTVKLALLEKEERLDNKGNVETLRKSRPPLDRYWLLLKYGYGVEFDKGSRIWQMGDAAQKKRNGLVHYEIDALPSVTTSELWGHLESILLLLIGPSAQIGKTVMPDQYELYAILDSLHPLIEEFEEKPGHKGHQIESTAVCFPCPFQNVDETKYPTMARQRKSNGTLPLA